MHPPECRRFDSYVARDLSRWADARISAVIDKLVRRVACTPEPTGRSFGLAYEQEVCGVWGGREQVVDGWVGAWGRWVGSGYVADNDRLIARRLDDNTPAAFFHDHAREHITDGYAVTVHSAQGFTADTTHAVLSETATRAMSYVAITRGRDVNTA